MENIKENNKIIAKFMGLNPMEMETFCGNCEEKLTVGDAIRYDKNYNAFCDDNDCCDGNRIINSTTLESCWFGDGNGTHINDLNYHTSWDWLMPVVKNIREIHNAELSIAEYDDTKEIVEMINPFDYNLEQVYKAVVEFVKWYNQQK